VDHLASSLDALAAFFAERMEGEDACIVAGVLAEARSAFRQAAESPHPMPAAAEYGEEQAEFLAALLDGRRKDAFAVADRWYSEGRSLIDLEEHIIAPALHRIGDMWQLNQVTVAREHMATAIAQSVMTGGLLRSSPPAMTSRKVLLACVEGNNHAIGLNMVSDAFQLDGWDVLYLGANMPTSDLVEQIVGSAPDLVGLSVSFPAHLCAVRTVVDLLDSRLGALRPRVIVGGLAANQFGAPTAGAHADAFIATAAAGVVYGNQLVEARAHA
jgi:methanogenic corrinoid protein MtbC1